MNSIEIRHPHSLTKRQARTVIETLASEFSARHGAGYRWEDDTLVFSRFGMRGSIELLPGEILIRAALGFLYLSRRDAMVAKVTEFLAVHADTKDPKVILAAARRYAAVSAHERPPPKKKSASGSKPKTKAQATSKPKQKPKPPSAPSPSSPVQPAQARQRAPQKKSDS